MRIKKINPPQNKTVHVVAAVIENALGKIFIAKRPAHVHQGGLWEFPGGKVEEHESAKDALARELFEELDIRVLSCEPLIQLSHHYPDKSIFLDVWRLTDFDGNPYGKEGQQTRWVNKLDLNQFHFPAANKAIIDAATLPQHYLITPEPDFQQRNLFIDHIEKKLNDGIKLIQLRAKTLNPQQLGTLYNEIMETSQAYKAELFINSSIKFAQDIGANKVHLSSAELKKTNHLPEKMRYAASCHTEQDINKACQLGINFIVISPVLKTASHPSATPLNWEKFKTLCRLSSLPVYALGGMKRTHLPHAIEYGAQGISAIRSLW